MVVNNTSMVNHPVVLTKRDSELVTERVPAIVCQFCSMDDPPCYYPLMSCYQNKREDGHKYTIKVRMVQYMILRMVGFLLDKP